MFTTILISQNKECRRVALLRGNDIIDVDQELPGQKTTPPWSLDQILWGRILRVDKTHAFVKLPNDTLGLLPLETPFPKPIEGHAVLVQVKREAIPDKGTKNKGPVLTRKIVFGGRYCLFHPFHNKRQISSKIQESAHRNRLQSLIPSDEPFTIREAATKAKSEQITEEMALLRQKYKVTESLADQAPCVTPYDAIPSSERWIRDLEALEGNSIFIDNLQTLKEVTDFLKIHRPDLIDFIKKHKAPLFQEFGLEDYWDSLFEDVIPLSSGGNIVFDVTAAAIVIDVNQGDKDARETNLEAIPPMIKQLKGRHIGGNVIIDFIGLETSFQERDTLKAELLKYADQVNLPLDIFGWSKLGWLEARLPKKRLPLDKIGKH